MTGPFFYSFVETTIGSMTPATPAAIVVAQARHVNLRRNA
jgi:hypothetical protein